MFEARLQRLAARIDGVRAVALVARDGIPVESWPSDTDFDLEALCAELLTPVRGFAGSAHDGVLGVVRQFAVVTDQVTLMLTAVSDGYYLLLVLGAEGSFGRARYELRRAELDFVNDLM